MNEVITSQATEIGFTQCFEKSVDYCIRIWGLGFQDPKMLAAVSNPAVGLIQELNAVAFEGRHPRVPRC